MKRFHTAAYEGGGREQSWHAHKARIINTRISANGTDAMLPIAGTSPTPWKPQSAA